MTQTTTVTATGRPRAVILTALGTEYAAVRSHLTELKEEKHLHGTLYEVGSFDSGTTNWHVGIAEIGAGNDGSAAEAERAMAFFSPHVILFVGVAGGLKDLNLGDVVASTKVYGYESGKADRQYHPRPSVGMPSYALEQRARTVIRQARWLARIRGEAPTTPPTAKPGPIAAGDKVVSSTRSDIYAYLRHQYGDALAVEMEGRGFLTAARLNAHVEALVVRGISDLITKKGASDRAGWQDRASRHAAAFAFELLATYVPPHLEAVLPSSHPTTGPSPTARRERTAGNLLGDSRGELDHEMLNKAFIETPDFKALARTTDYNFVVGRRGTGKSALFHKLTAEFTSEGNLLVVTSMPSEHHTMMLESTVASFANTYADARPVTRLLWRISILLAVAEELAGHYKIKKTSAHANIVHTLQRYGTQNVELELVERCLLILRKEVSANTHAESLMQLADAVRVEDLQKSVQMALREIEGRAVVLHA
jgi:nucleoside phosphorylase